MRKELKYIFKEDEFDSFYANLLEIGFRELYNSRSIFSIYYDTESFTLFNLSEDGFSERTKVRVRFYNQKVNDAFLEFKHKIDQAGHKTSQPITKFKNLILLSSVKFPDLKLPEKINGDLIPVIGVNYKRHYLISKCGAYRITLDQNLSFGKLTRTSNKYNISFDIFYPFLVLEIKSSLDFIISDKTFLNIIDHFDLNLSKFSKYCTGIKLLY